MQIFTKLNKVVKLIWTLKHASVHTTQQQSITSFKKLE